MMMMMMMICPCLLFRLMESHTPSQPKASSKVSSASSSYLSLPVCLSVCLSTCLSACLSVYLSVCLSLLTHSACVAQQSSRALKASTEHYCNNIYFILHELTPSTEDDELTFLTVNITGT